MQFFTKSLIASAVVSLLTACGGGSEGSSNNGSIGGGDKPSLQITGQITESNTKKSNLEVRLYSGDNLVKTVTPTRQADEHQPRYFIPLVEEEVGTLPLTLVAVAVPIPPEDDQTANAASSDAALIVDEDRLQEERILFKTEIGTLAKIKTADINQDNFVTHKEHLPLTLSATNTLLSVLDKTGEKTAVEVMQEQDRARVLAIAAVAHTAFDPFDAEKQVELPSFDLEPKAFIEKILEQENLALSALTDEETWLDRVKIAYINVSKELYSADVTEPNQDTKVVAKSAEEPAVELDPQAELEAKWIQRIHDKWIEMHAVKQTNVVRQVLDSSYPARSLTFRGEIVQGLADPYVSVQIGSYPNDPLASSHYDNPLKPLRPAVVQLTKEGEEQTYASMPVEGTEFEFTISLPDTAQAFDSCQPTGYGVYVYKDLDSDLTKPSKHPTDNMQDLLTVVVQDESSGVEMRSFLGAFCELAKPEIDKNGDGIVTVEELPRLQVSFENAAHVLLAERSNLQHHGGAQFAKPVSQAAIAELLAKHSVDQDGNEDTELLELMSTIIAMQIASFNDNTIPAIDNAGDFFKTAATLLGLDYNAQYRMYGKSNILPEPFEVIALLKNIADVAHGMYDNDVTINTLIKQSAQALAGQSQFTEDQAIANKVNASIANDTSWLPAEPVNGLESVCTKEFADDQIRGIFVRGQGDDWVTLEWQSIDGSDYTVYWNETVLEDMTTSTNKLATTHNRVTIRGLTQFQDYHFQITHQGTPSTTFMLHKGNSGLINPSMHNDDFSCDTMTGLARNSNSDGYKAMTFLKVDDKGESLSRQDLPYQVLPHACTVNTKTGLTWAVPNAQMNEGDRIRHWYGLDNRYVHGSDVTLADDKFNGFCVNESGEVYSADRAANCNTEAIVERANQANFCGINDWRLPTYNEILKVVTLTGKPVLQYDDAFFPNLDSNKIWIKGTNPGQTTHGFQFSPSSWSIGSNIEWRNVPTQLILVSDGLQVPAK